jgi:hypothetical protein
MKFCAYYFFISLGITFVAYVVGSFTEYGYGNYCYLTDALVVFFECKNFIFSRFFEFVLNWPYLLLYSFMMSFGSIREVGLDFGAVLLLPWLPIFIYAGSLFFRVCKSASDFVRNSK